MKKGQGQAVRESAPTIIARWYKVHPACKKPIPLILTRFSAGTGWRRSKKNQLTWIHLEEGR